MTENEWLSSDCPFDMIAHLGPSFTKQQKHAWVLACRAEVESSIGWTGWANLEAGDQPDYSVSEWCVEDNTWDDVCPTPWRAHALRDIVGNPWRPVMLPREPVVCHICDGHGGELRPTFDIPPRRCPYCGAELQDDVGRPAHERWCPRCWAVVAGNHIGYKIDKPCTCCKGAKTTPGPCPWLSPTVLDIAHAIDAEGIGHEMPILADALEEEGCRGEELLRHLRGEERCLFCFGLQGWLSTEKTDLWKPCFHCNGTGWMPLRGEHVKGCWAIALLKGGI